MEKGNLLTCKNPLIFSYGNLLWIVEKSFARCTLRDSFYDFTYVQDILSLILELLLVTKTIITHYQRLLPLQKCQ